MIKVQTVSDPTGTRITLKSLSGEDLINVEYDKASQRVFVWDMSKPLDEGPEITIKLQSIAPQEYAVRWTTQVSANSLQEAAQIAAKMQRDPTMLATAFDVALEDDPNAQWETVEVPWP